MYDGSLSKFHLLSKPYCLHLHDFWRSNDPRSYVWTYLFFPHNHCGRFVKGISFVKSEHVWWSSFLNTLHILLSQIIELRDMCKMTMCTWSYRQYMDHCHHTCNSIKTTWFASPMNMCKFVPLTIIMFHAIKSMSFSCTKLICKSCKTYSFNDLTILQLFFYKVKIHGPTLRSHNEGTQALITWDFLMLIGGVKS
jgi:hypothetical protein